CVDLADLLAAAAAGLGRAVLLSGDLRRLDREALTQLAVAGVAVVGLVPDHDESGERRLRQLGVGQVLTPAATAADVAAAVRAALGATAAAPAFAVADPGAAFPAPPPPRHPVPADRPAATTGEGRVVAAWGPTGAPGRTSVAIGLAAELAELGVETLLVDADSYGGAVAQLLGLLDEAPGLAAACRLANNGSLDVAGLAELALQVRPRLRVLTGISRAERWPELRPSALEVVLALARHLAAVTVVDCGFCLERDEELSFDTAAPRRNGATLTALSAADDVVAVATADPVGLQRFIRALPDLGEVVAPGVRPMTVVNRVRPAVVGGGDPRGEIAAALERFAAVTQPFFLPLDPAGFDTAVAGGRTLAEAAPSSPARPELRRLAASVGGVPAPRRHRRTLRRAARRSRRD
ncbi:MAG TPA: hypothetical protein VFT62_03365, partial [Mycobacteriales bacterium]|nr:hypothetical protein [Mycobacteriales bacterium]